MPTGAPPDFPLERYRNGRVLEIEGGQLTVLVYRGGRLARLGHNHTITSTAVQGLLLQAENDNLQASYADLYVPLASFIVDDPAARLAAGEDFSSTPSTSDREGTRANMLGPKLLDAQQYPYLQASITLATQSLAQVALTIRDHNSTHRVPVSILPSDNGFAVEATFTATHAELGLEPFSVLGGAIKVADPITIQIRLAAARRSGLSDP